MVAESIAFSAASQLQWRPRRLRDWMLLNLLLALGYGLAARLGLVLAFGPAQTTAVWPAAGLALSALLLWGWGALPGLVLASLGVDVHAGDWVDPSSALGAGLLLTLAAALQWMLVHFLLADWWGRMQNAALRFALRFVGVVMGGCLLASSLGNAVLLANDKLTLIELPHAWLTWWVGDVAGMLVMTPLLLIALHRGVRARCVANQAFPVLAIGLGLTLAGSLSLGHLERATSLATKRSDLRSLAMALQSQVALAEADLARLGDLHYRIQLSEDEFHDAASNLRTQHAWLSGFAYLAHVPQAEREDWERRLSLRFASVQADGVLNTAPLQSSYWVTLRLDPLGGQEARLGVDEGSDPLRRPAFEAALANQRTAMTPVLSNLHYAANESLAVLMVRPVYESTTQTSPVRGRPTGLVSAALQLRTLLQSALQQFDRWDDPLLLLSDDPQPAGLRIDRDGVSELQPEAAAPVLAAWLKEQHLTQTIDFADRHWQLRSLPPQRGLRPSPMQIGSLAVGLAFTGLLTAFVVARARRDQALAHWHEELESQVSARTQELAALNQNLRDEVVERQRMADQLRANSLQLAQQQAQLRTLLDHIPDPVWMKDLQGCYTLVNPALAKFFARRPEELLGHPAADFLDPEVIARDRELDASALLTGTPMENDNESRDARGRRHVHTITRVAVRDAEGQRIGVLGVARDITRRLEREEVLRRFRWLADSAAQGFAIGDLQGRVVYLNDVAKRWLNDPDWNEDLDRGARDYLAPEARRRLAEEILPAVYEQGSWSGELAVQGLAGATPPPLLSSLFLMRDELGQPHYLAQVMTDISERRRLEQALTAARHRAEDASRAKSAFLANMSHEIRTPLNAVLGYAQLLREDEQLPPVARERVHSIYNAGSRLLRLINDVLDLSKIEAGALQLNLEKVELGREIEESLRLLAERARSAGLALRQDIDLPRPLYVLADRGKLGQVLVNLLGNAIKFTSAGSVSLKAWLAGETELRVEVIDTGAGIATEELRQLFTPFVQGESGQLRGGTGLGLSLSRSLLRAMGGELELESTPGQGTTARLRLALERCEAPAEAPERPSVERRLAPGDSCRVLVVEDDPDSRKVLEALLLRVGCTVDTAGDGAQALALCRRQRYALILSDMRMPVMDGVTLRQHLAADPVLASIPIVAVTASSLQHEREAYIAMGFADFIAKPYDFAQILLMLGTHGGARLVDAPGVAAPPAPAAVAAAPSGPLPEDQRAAWQQALEWAQAGRAVELRAWTQALPDTEAGARQALLAALARYDLQAVEDLLRSRLA